MQKQTSISYIVSYIYSQLYIQCFAYTYIQFTIQFHQRDKLGVFTQAYALSIYSQIVLYNWKQCTGGIQYDMNIASLQIFYKMRQETEIWLPANMINLSYGRKYTQQPTNTTETINFITLFKCKCVKASIALILINDMKNLSKLNCILLQLLNDAKVSVEKQRSPIQVG